MADGQLRVSYRTAPAAVSRVPTITVAFATYTSPEYTLSPISRDASESRTDSLYLVHHGFKPLLSLFLHDITVPVLFWCQIGRSTLRMGVHEGGLHGLFAIQLAETELSPKYTDGVQLRQGARSYSSVRGWQLALALCEKKNGGVLTPQFLETSLNLLHAFLAFGRILEVSGSL
jgi:hypothetical protein